MRRPMLLMSSVLVATMGMAVPTSAAPAAPAPPTAPPAKAVADPGQGFAVVDQEAMTYQAHRLEAIAAGQPEGSGGVIFDEDTGQLVVRYLDNSHGKSLKALVNAAARRAGDVPVRFELTDKSAAHLETAAKQLDADRGWAGANAGRVHQVMYSPLEQEIHILASGAIDELTVAAQKATGITPHVQFSEHGIVPHPGW